MKSLPKELEQESPRDSTRHLLGFSLDVDLVRRVGEESALDNELENAIVDFGGWESDGTFAITTRGPAIENLADILEDYLSKYPRSVIVKKWLKGSIASASAMILAYRQPVCNYQGMYGICILIMFLLASRVACSCSSGSPGSSKPTTGM